MECQIGLWPLNILVNLSASDACGSSRYASAKLSIQSEYLKIPNSQNPLFGHFHVTLRNDVLYVLAWVARVACLRGWLASVGGVSGVFACVACLREWRGWRANLGCILLLLLLPLSLKYYPEEKMKIKTKNEKITKIKKFSK